MAGEVHYADTVYQPKGGGIGYVWCEEYARMHTLIEARYQNIAFEATHTAPLIPERPFEKGKRLAESGWEKTPADARKSNEDALGVQLDDKSVIWRKTIPVSFPLKIPT